MTNFCSDNTAGASPEILEALTRASEGAVMPYGADPVTQAVEARFQELFETDCEVFPVATGTAANVLGLAVMTPPYGAIYCHESAHINVDECGAPELYTGGAKLVLLEGAHGKFSPEGLEQAIGGAGNVHSVQPAAVSLTQGTEAGTVYRPDEVGAIAEVARAHGLGVHMDGARFANAVAALGVSPAEITWKAGVDALAFGATKNGALAAEAVVLFKPELAETAGFRRKRGGHLFSKMRFLSAQLEAYLTDDHWLANARHANAMARRLAEGLAAVPGVEILHPVEINEIFPRFPKAMAEGLKAEGFLFYTWGGDEDRVEARLVTAFNTRPEDVEAMIAAAGRLSGGGEVRKSA